MESGGNKLTDTLKESTTAILTKLTLAQQLPVTLSLPNYMKIQQTDKSLILHHRWADRCDLHIWRSFLNSDKKAYTCTNSFNT